MNGEIDSYNPETRTGVIKSEAQTFEFDAQSWVASVPPEQGDAVVFETDGTRAVNVTLQGAVLTPPEGVKRKYVAAFLALFLGFTGAHRFYLGFYKLGIAQLAITGLTVGYGALWGFIEAVLLFAGHINKDAKGRPLK